MYFFHRHYRTKRTNYCPYTTETHRNSTEVHRKSLIGPTHRPIGTRPAAKTASRPSHTHYSVHSPLFHPLRNRSATLGKKTDDKYIVRQRRIDEWFQRLLRKFDDVRKG